MFYNAALIIPRVWSKQEPLKACLFCDHLEPHQDPVLRLKLLFKKT